jgi:pyridoxamine 5'-phosphate oxidase family protein
MTFKAHEIAYLRDAELGRLATIQRDGTPQNSPVGFFYNEELGTIDIPGYNMSTSQKFRNIAHNDKVAFVVDDVTSRDPWRVRCLEIRGVAEQASLDKPPIDDVAHRDMDLAIIRIFPRRIISFGVETPDLEPHELVPDNRDV